MGLKRTEEAERCNESHNCLNRGIEVHGHMQCAVCGRVIESCCEGGPLSEGNILSKKSVSGKRHSP